MRRDRVLSSSKAGEVAKRRREEEIDSLAEEIRREGGEGTPMVADTSDFEQVKAVADRAVEEYGRLDTWVHLAAVGLFATFEQTTPEEFARHRREPHGAGLRRDGRPTTPQAGGPRRPDPHLLGRSQALLPVPQRLRGLQARHRRVS